MANARIKARARVRVSATAACNKFRRKEMRTVKYSRGMRKSRDDNAGCQPRAGAFTSRALKRRMRRGAARRSIKRGRARSYGERETEISLRLVTFGSISRDGSGATTSIRRIVRSRVAFPFTKLLIDDRYSQMQIFVHRI